MFNAHTLLRVHIIIGVGAVNILYHDFACMRQKSSFAGKSVFYICIIGAKFHTSESSDDFACLSVHVSMVCSNYTKGFTPPCVASS